MKKGFIGLCCFLVCTCYMQAQTIPTAQQLLQKLNTYHSDQIAHVSYYMFKPGYNISDSVKAKMLSLLRHEWTDEEVQAIINRRFKESFEYEYFEEIDNRARQVYKELYPQRFLTFLRQSRSDSALALSKQYRALYDSVYQRIYDSTATVYKTDLERKIRESVVPDEIVLGAAQAGLTEAISLLKKELQGPNHYYTPEVAKLALVKLGDAAYKSELLNMQPKTAAEPFEREEAMALDFRLSFIGSQESVYAYHLLLDTVHRAHRDPEDYQMRSYVARYMLPTLLNLVTNPELHAIFKGVIYDAHHMSGEDLTAPMIIQAKQWLIQNKGRYVINKNFPFPYKG